MGFGFYPPEKLSDKEKQSAHFRTVYVVVLILLFILIIAGFATIGYAVIVLRIPKADLTEFYFMQGGLVGAFTGGFVSHVTGTSISSNKNADALRQVVQSTNPTSEQ